MRKCYEYGLSESSVRTVVVPKVCVIDDKYRELTMSVIVW
jgi:hypothetical protein